MFAPEPEKAVDHLNTCLASQTFLGCILVSNLLGGEINDPGALQMLKVAILGWSSMHTDVNVLALWVSSNTLWHGCNLVHISQKCIIFL